MSDNEREVSGSTKNDDKNTETCGSTDPEITENLMKNRPNVASEVSTLKDLEKSDQIDDLLGGGDQKSPKMSTPPDDDKGMEVDDDESQDDMKLTWDDDDDEPMDTDRIETPKADINMSVESEKSTNKDSNDDKNLDSNVGSPAKVETAPENDIIKSVDETVNLSPKDNENDLATDTQEPTTSHEVAIDSPIENIKDNSDILETIEDQNPDSTNAEVKTNEVDEAKPETPVVHSSMDVEEELPPSLNVEKENEAAIEENADDEVSSNTEIDLEQINKEKTSNVDENNLKSVTEIQDKIVDIEIDEVKQIDNTSNEEGSKIVANIGDIQESSTKTESSEVLEESTVDVLENDTIDNIEKEIDSTKIEESSPAKILAEETSFESISEKCSQILEKWSSTESLEEKETTDALEKEAKCVNTKGSSAKSLEKVAIDSVQEKSQQSLEKSDEIIKEKLSSKDIEEDGSPVKNKEAKESTETLEKDSSGNVKEITPIVKNDTQNIESDTKALETEITSKEHETIEKVSSKTLITERISTDNENVEKDTRVSENESSTEKNEDTAIREKEKDSQDDKERDSQVSASGSIEANTTHGIKKPDVMLEIPNLEFMDEYPDSVENEDEKETEQTETKNTDVKESKGDKHTDSDKKSEVSMEVDEIQKSVNVSSPKAAKDDVQPSTSMADVAMAPDTSDEVPEVTDRLGLLAESSRVMEYDEEPEEEEDGDDDDDFDPYDESSNQMTAEHSEESNPPHSESETKDQPDTTDAESIDKNNKESSVEEKNFKFEISNVSGGKGMEVDEVVDDDTNQAVSDDVDIEQHVADAVAKTETDVKVKEKETTPQPEPSAVKETDNVKDTKTEDSSKEANKEPDKETIKQSPSKKIKLEISQPKHEINIVELEESSSEDDLQEIKNIDTKPSVTIRSVQNSPSLDVAAEVEVPLSSDDPKLWEVDITEVPGTGAAAETEQTDANKEKPKSKLSLEIFSLDSDDDESAVKAKTKEPSPPLEPEKAQETNKCINFSCKSEGSIYFAADAACIAFYDAGRKKKPLVCLQCYSAVQKRAQGLIDGIKNFTPLLELELGKMCEELVEISDSDSDDEGDNNQVPKETIGVEGAKFVEENLADAINEAWIKFKMDDRLRDTQDSLSQELDRLEKESQDLDSMLNECQAATDKLRTTLYATFEQERKELPAISICDVPETFSIGFENPAEARPKRKASLANQNKPSKLPAIPLGYTPLDTGENTQTQNQETKPGTSATEKIDDDNVDISVVQLSAESAPADLPPPGEISRPPLRPGMTVYAVRSTFGSWMKAKIVECVPKGSNSQFTNCRVKFEHRVKNSCTLLAARSLAYAQPAQVRLTIGTRVIALFTDVANANAKKGSSYYAGVIAEVPNPVNSYRYLVFFDDGYAQYVSHAHTRLVCECSPLVWEEVHPFSRQFVREYLLAYPERPMVRLHAGQKLKTEWNGKWWISRVLQVDASLVHVFFEEDNRTEWIYRGSTRLAPLYLELQAAERHRARPMPRSKAQTKSNMPYVEYTRSDEAASQKNTETQQQQQEQELRRQRAVAKKSTTPSVPPPPQHNAGVVENVTSRVVYYTPKNAVKPYKMSPHTCGPKCKRTDVLALKDLRTYNPLAKPLLSGWERQLVRHKGVKEVMYRAPCGRRVRNMCELHAYLRATRSDMAVDLFDFAPATHCLAEFVLNKCIVGKKDLSHGKENVPVPCVNYYDDTLPEFCSYNTERTPTAGVPLNLDTDFLCGCDCTDDCEDKSKCACWKMTLEGARTIGLEGENVGYVYKRLPEPLPSGIYECNSRCKCKHTCLNRVAQHPLQLKLQVFKTLNRGWGIRALNDVPKGSFICVYAGNLLTDATANLDGLNEGDEYLAELDYIEVVEQMKEGYEEDIPNADKKLDKKESGKEEETSEEEESSSEDETSSKNDETDGDFVPGYIGMGVMEFSKRLRKRDKKKEDKKKDPAQKEKEKQKDGEDKREGDEDCITISDDEEVREPSRFMAQAGMAANQFVSKYSSVRTLYGKDEACYIMDAKVQGNIGRYLNHSCQPNVFVQNVFVDTHDPRFPWVAFFALSHIRAGTELTWNYNYDVGSVPGKVLYCYCGAPNCRGRLL